MSVWVWRLSQNTLERLDIGVVESLDASTALIPGGAYTTLRTYHGVQTLLLEDHFLRLEETSRLAGAPVQIDRDGLRQALRRVIQASQQLIHSEKQEAEAPDLRLRLTLDLEKSPGDLYLAAQVLQTPPPEAYRQGVRAITCKLQRINPKAKLTRFIQRSGAIRQSIPVGVNEAIMYDEQENLLEGLSSNFYAVIDGMLFTAEEGVLSGLTRSLVIESGSPAGGCAAFSAGSPGGTPAFARSLYHLRQPGGAAAQPTG